MRSKDDVWELLDKICRERVNNNEALEPGIGRCNSDMVQFRYTNVCNNKSYREEKEFVSMRLLQILTDETIQKIIVDILVEFRSDSE